MTLAHQASLIARKDLLIEVRGRHALGTLLPFAATVLIAFGFVFGPGLDVPNALRRASCGWRCSSPP